MGDQRLVRAACQPKGNLGQRRSMFLARQEQTPSPRAGTRQVGRPVPGNSGLGGDSIRAERREEGFRRWKGGVFLAVALLSLKAEDQPWPILSAGEHDHSQQSFSL